MNSSCASSRNSWNRSPTDEPGPPAGPPVCDDGAVTDIGATLAATFVARCARAGLSPDPGLRLLSHRVDGTVPVVDDGPLGEIHEALTGSDERRGRGAWYTPTWLAEDLVARVIDEPGAVADPACGGGVFLLAAADRLVSLGAAPGRIVGELLWGCDIDPLAAAITEAELWRWSAERDDPTVAGAHVVVGDALVDVAIPVVSAVVGNPPFLGQLKSSTSSDAERRRQLSERWGPSVQPYTDVAWLFLLAAVDAVDDDGAVALVMPQSLLAARDASTIREHVDERMVLDDCWVDDGRAFAAAVDVCAPVLRRRHGIAEDRANDWVGALGDATGVPCIELAGTATLGERAELIAGFRDEYYGLVGAVTEGGSGPRLVTSGAIDPLRLVDGGVRFAKQRWNDPVVDVTRTVGRSARWVRAQAVPKLIVASQTKVIEAVVDPDGTMVAGVPAIVVCPHDPDDTWHLAAALHAPVISAWMLRRTVGSALSRDACKPTAALLAELPLPVAADHWGRAAGLAAAIADGAHRWEEFAVAADLAYGVDDDALRAWWLGRLPLR